MALIKRLKERHMERNRVHNDVEATFTIFRDENDVYLQIDTYGSSQRAIPGKVSQSIQFNRQSLQQLREIIESQFRTS